VIRAGLEDVVVLTRERRLRALLPKHAVLLRRQLGAPLGFGLLDLLHALQSREEPLRFTFASSRPSVARARSRSMSESPLVRSRLNAITAWRSFAKSRSPSSVSSTFTARPSAVSRTR